MKVYLDSSSFAKRFVEESGSDAVVGVCDDASALGLSVLCVPEIISALNRRRREHVMTPSQYDSAKRRLVSDVRDADIIGLTSPVIACCIHVLESGPARTLDALHVASAFEWKADLFVSSDKQQLTAARRVGLKTKNI